MGRGRVQDLRRSLPDAAQNATGPPGRSLTGGVGTVRQNGAVRREGPFWDAVDGRAPLPAAAVTLGWELVSVNPQEGTIEVAFAATEAFLNPAGVIQGGFLAAMLDDTLGPALVACLNPGDFAPTTDLHCAVSAAGPARSPARPGTRGATRS